MNYSTAYPNESLDLGTIKIDTPWIQEFILENLEYQI